MTRLALAALAGTALLMLSACGSSNDASKDATATNVEMPADKAMAGTPMPSPDPGASADQSIAATQGEARKAAASAQAMVDQSSTAASDKTK